MTKRGASLLIGWREWVELPDLGGARIKAKVDTGARTSALHAEDIHYVKRGKKRFVHFLIFPKQRVKKRGIKASAPLLDERRVRSSNGKEEVRPVIETTLELHGESWPIELTLTRRDLMGFRLLLGRQALRNHVLIDPAKSFLAGA